MKTGSDNGDYVKARKWDMVEGRLTRVKIGDEFFCVDGNSEPNVEINISRKKMGRIPSLKKYITENLQPGDEFCLEEFFKDHPNQKRQHQRLVPVISTMINKKKLQQLSKDTFKVLK